MIVFFIVLWLSLLAILITAPEIIGATLRLSSGDDHRVEIAFVAAISAFIALLTTGVARRWRWTFWLILVAFVAGLLRLPAAALQLTGHLEAPGPTWYVLFQAVLGLIQFLIGIAMLLGYRKAGTWGSY